MRYLHTLDPDDLRDLFDTDDDVQETDNNS